MVILIFGGLLLLKIQGPFLNSIDTGGILVRKLRSERPVRTGLLVLVMRRNVYDLLSKGTHWFRSVPLSTVG
jgi:hypothetical protein